MELVRCEICGVDAVKGTLCPKSIECPQCHAPAGSPCMRPSGHRAADMHQARWRETERIDAENGVGPEQIARAIEREQLEQTGQLVIE